jgi:hypothetical protein
MEEPGAMICGVSPGQYREGVNAEVVAAGVTYEDVLIFEGRHCGRVERGADTLPLLLILQRPFCCATRLRQPVTCGTHCLALLWFLSTPKQPRKAFVVNHLSNYHTAPMSHIAMAYPL